MFNQIVHQRLKKPDFNQVVDGDALQLAGRGSWFVATSEELPELQRRVDESDDYSVVTGRKRSGEHSVRRWRLSKMPLPEETVLQSLLLREKSRSVAQERAALSATVAGTGGMTLPSSYVSWLPAGSFATSVVREPDQHNG